MSPRNRKKDAGYSVKMDVATGLPALPEGWYWEVGMVEDDYDPFYGVRYQRTKKLVKGVMIREKVEAWVAVNEPVYWLGLRIGSKSVLKKMEEVKTHASGTFWKLEYFPETGGRSRTAIPVTRESVLQRATEVYQNYMADAWESAHEEDRKRTAKKLEAELFGEYPPKRL